MVVDLKQSVKNMDNDYSSRDFLKGLAHSGLQKTKKDSVMLAASWQCDIYVNLAANDRVFIRGIVAPFGPP